jgi:RNA polymerase sigma-70 factor (ECF subfamily)
MQAGMAGDAGAYRKFLVLVTPHLRALARAHQRGVYVTGSEVEDVVQEVLLAVHLKRGTWDTSRPIYPWLAAIARNKMIDALRRRGRYIQVPIEDVIDTLQAEEQVDGLETRELDELLKQLKPRQRDIVQSISLNECSIRETAGRFGMTEGAVRVALHRGLKALAALYRARTS